MLEQRVSLASNGVVKVPGYEQLVRFGYTKNRGVYRLAVTATGEWEGLTIRAFWHTPGGKDPPSSLVADGYVDVPASVTAQSGNGCITFEGSDGTKTVTSADLRYRVSANSGTEDGTEPEPGTPAWQQLVDIVHTNAAAAEQAQKGAETAATRSESAADRAESAQQKTEEVCTDALDKISAAKADALKAVDAKQAAATAAVESTSKKALDAVTAAQGTAAKAVSDAQSTATQAVQTAQTDAVSDVEKAGSEVLASIPEDYQNTVQKVEELKIEKAEIDDSTVGLDAWSSKHIVDMLCPPLEETGNPVQCYPVAGYPLGCKVSWEPTQEGTGDPSPDNVRPIKGRNSVTVERCGENLIQLPVFSLDVDKGQRTKTIFFTVPRPAGTYAISLDSSNSTSGLGIQVFSMSDMLLSISRLPYTFYASKPIDRLYFYISANKGNKDTVTDITLVRSAIIPATHISYTGQTTTLTLPHTIYGGTVDAVTGEGQEAWKLVTLDGTEQWYERTTVASAGYTSYSTGLPYPSQTGFCTHYKKILYAAIKPDNPTGETGCYLEYSTSAIFNVPFENVGSWKNYLAAQYAAGTPVQIVYQFAQYKNTFTATGAQPIPALSGCNTVLTDADKLTVTGRADPIKRITDLEDAVASMT